MNFVSRINCYQYRTNFYSCPECNIPCRYIGSPNRYMIPLLHTHSNQSTSKIIYILTELHIRSCIVASSIPKCILIRKFIAHAIQHLRECEINKLLFRPHIFTGAPCIRLQFSHHIRGADIFPHIVHKMGEYNSRRFQIRHIPLQPFQRNISFIIDGTQCGNKVGNRQIALTHHAVFNRIAVHYRILNMGIFNICTKILNRRLGIFACEPVGMMHIPQSADRVAFNSIKNLTQTLGIGIHSVCLNKKHYAGSFCLGSQNPQSFYNICIIEVRGDLRSAVA
ncbi:hypothetical protein IMSAG013_00132 [Clostridiales bacterium]|nr:hypothetical protein IMSAG013_00132 [Clostridiales bacterium]